MADNRASCWSVTINNPQPSDFEDMAVARQRGWKVDGQQEVGKEGTPHLQLMVRTPQVRFSAVKKMFPRGHIEAARNQPALANYVTKAETRVAQLPTGSDMYPSLSKYWYLLAVKLNNGNAHWTNSDKMALLHPEQITEENGYIPRRAYMYSATLDRIVDRDPLKNLDNWTEELIAEGYVVESLAMNPAVRSAWRKWWRAIVFRAMETARQTDSVQILTTQTADLEHNHADDSTRPQAALGILEGIYGEEVSCEEGESRSEESRTTGSEGGDDNR